ncbi:hypothetical protein IQ24_01701 [Paracoccus sulfuroxidans]|uniref:Uncharacterized protein n=1 Tax=Paracoccus sulfuroxidans TaxID=384678 RepID=A0A562NSZ5_9RHOB|nr:hypothetical protein IQ24_01701 [Paracoccus sulfuroxidans]
MAKRKSGTTFLRRLPGLSDAQQQALDEAREVESIALATARAARVTIDELEGLGLRSDNILEKLASEARAHRLEIQRISTQTPQPRGRQDYPRKASRMLPVPERSIFLPPPPVPPLPDPLEARAVYQLVRSLHGFAATFGLARGRAIKALKIAGIDIYEDIAREWEAGCDTRELSRRHGPGRDTIARWIRKTGRTVLPRNSNWRYDEALIAETFDKAGSVNKAAEAAGVSWTTAGAVLSRYGIGCDGRSRGR